MPVLRLQPVDDAGRIVSIGLGKGGEDARPVALGDGLMEAFEERVEIECWRDGFGHRFVR
jgi:hypothetical protein